MDQIEDRLAIRDLTSRYAYYVDTFQNEKLMELWAEDAVFDESRVGTGLHVGARAIGAFFDELKKTVTHQAHITANQLIEELQDPGLSDHVEGAGGFIGNQELRFADHGACDADSAAMSRECAARFPAGHKPVVL